MTATATRRRKRVPERAQGCVLWIYGQAWEDGDGLDGLHSPTPFDEWVAFLINGDVELTHLRQFGLTHLFQVARSWRAPSSLVDADRGLCQLA